jgi:valyl-tRNA synthetase
LVQLGDLGTFATHEADKEWVIKTKEVSEQITSYIDSYQFNLAAERLYEFIWHEFADKYIEEVKGRADENSLSVIQSILASLLALLHPFMPFVTEEIYLKMPGAHESIMIEPWPVAIS